MSVAKRGKHYSIRFRPFGGPVIGLSTKAKSKVEAKAMEMAILTACRSGDYGALSVPAREACIRLFQNQKWEVPSELGGVSKPKEELTLWRASELFQNYPEIQASKKLGRYQYALVHIVKHFGKERSIKSIWVPDLKTYQIERLNQGAAAATINRELSTLSRLFSVLIELQLVENNPVRLLKRLSEKSGERQVYLSMHDVHLIADKCPGWYQLVLWTAYYTGMRRGEIFSLTRKQVNLSRRMIVLGPEDTKERHWKRIPIHQDLVPYLKEALRLASLVSDKVFLVRDEKGIRPLGKETFKNPWPRACEALEKAELLSKPFPHFHDLRHTWKSNALSSGMDPEIRESILGHWSKGKTVTERYGRIKDDQLLKAIDLMTFDHGETEILVGSARDNDQAQKTCTKRVQNSAYKENQDASVGANIPISG